jgi:hypothetical protein
MTIFVLISVPLVLSQGNPSAQANIHISDVTSKFVSLVSKNYTNNDYYLIGSVDQRPSQTISNTSNVANKTSKIQPGLNETVINTTSSKIEMGPSIVNRTAPLVMNIYNISIIINNGVGPALPAINETSKENSSRGDPADDDPEEPIDLPGGGTYAGGYPTGPPPDPTT